MGSSARSLADGGNNTVLSRVERIILSRLGLQLANDLVQTRSLRNNELSHVKGLRAIAWVNLDDNLSNSSGVGDLVDHLNVEGGSLRTLGRVYGDALDGASSVVVVRAQVDLNTDPEGIRVSTKKPLARRGIIAVLLDEVSKLHDSDDVANDVTDFSLPGLVKVAADGSTATEDSNVGDDLNELVDGSKGA